MLAVAETIMLTIRVAYWIIHCHLCQCARPELSGSMIRLLLFIIGQWAMYICPVNNITHHFYVLLYTWAQLLSSINTTFNSKPLTEFQQSTAWQKYALDFTHTVTLPVTKQALMIIFVKVIPFSAYFRKFTITQSNLKHLGSFWRCITRLPITS